jgi:hypothetical protein
MPKPKLAERYKYSFVIPSLNRPDRVITLNLILATGRPIYIFVHTEEQKALYRASIPDEKKVQIVVTNAKGIGNHRNVILDHFDKGSRLVAMDDDVQAILKLEKNWTLQPLGPRELNEFIEHAFDIAARNNTKLWGVYPIPNHYYMSPRLDPKGFIIGAFCGIETSDLRYDPTLYVKEDYDFTIKHILRYRKIVRFNQYAVKAQHYTNKGGCMEYRTDKIEQKAIRRLKELYPLYIRDNPRRQNEILLSFQVKRLEGQCQNG